MSSSSIMGLINNAALLLAIGLLYDLMGPNNHHEASNVRGVVSGMVLGLIGIAIMLNPWEFSPGIVFDTRSVLLSITGLFFGTIPVTMAVVITGSFRLAMAGAGVWTGVAVIVTSGGIGLAWRRFRGKRETEITAGELFLLGAVVHGTMLLCMVSLPWPVAKSVLSHISLPVMLVCPVATTALGLLLVNRSRSKRVQKVLAQSEVLYRNLFMNHAAVKLIVDPHTGDIVEANRAAEEFYGWPIAQLERMRIQDINTLSPEEVNAEMERARTLNRIYFQFRHRRADGSVRDVDVFSSRIEINGKEMLHSIVHDVTERREAEEARKKSEEFQRAMIATSPVALYSIDLHGNVMTWNESAERIFGWRAEEVIGTPLPFVPDDKRDEFDTLRKRVLSGETFSNLEIVRQKKTGELFDCRLSTAPIQSDTGEVMGIMGALEDITPRKRTERALQESESQFRLLVESSPDAIFVQTEQKFAYVNRAAVRLFGAVNPEDLLGQPVMERFHPDFRGAVKDRIHSLNRQKSKVPTLEQIYLRMDGSHVPVEVSAVPIHYNGSDGALVFVRDISERRDHEAARRTLEEQLAQAQKMEAVGRLAGGVAHDLNNLLSPILGYGEMLVGDLPEDDSNRESVEEIVSAGYRARDIVRQLLAFSRRQPLEFKVLDTNRVMQDFEKLLRRTVREDIRIHMGFAENLAPILGDTGQIEQVIMNLVVNAQDAMPDGGKLTIESGVVDLDESYAEEHQGVTPGRYVMLAVSDTGHGMDKQTLDRVFEPFFTTKERGKGTGLGLSTVYGIVKQHGGNVWVYSEPQHGTTFKCYFPVAESARGAPEESDSTAPMDLRGDETVIVVEDNEAVRRMAVSILERYGYRVFSAANGKSCLNLLEKHDGPAHLLFTDVVMPDMNGKELYYEMTSQYPDIKVIYASGYTDNVIAHHGVLDEGIHFIQKPFSVQGLAAKVREVLDEK